MSLSDKQIEKRIRNIQRRMERVRERQPEGADKRLARLQTRLDKQQRLLALPPDQRPQPLKVTGDVLKGTLRGIGTLVPPPTGPLLKVVANVLDQTASVKNATRDGDATSVIDALQDSLGDALKRAGIRDASSQKLLHDLLDQLEDALDD